MPRLLTGQRLGPQIQKIRSATRRNNRRFIETQMRIPDLMGNLVRFKLNWTQQKLYNIIEEKHRQLEPVRLWVVKYRRAGITLLESARGYADIFSRDNARVAMIAHLKDRSAEILQNYKDIHSNLPLELQLQLSRDNIEGMRFEHTRGQALIATCENAIRVRGDGIHKLKNSEGAHFGKNFIDMIEEVSPVIPPKPGTENIIETTGSIKGCAAHEHCMEAKNGENEFDYIFLNWLDSPDCLIPFKNDRHREEILTRMHDKDPRLTEIANYFKMTPEQRHQLWVFYHYQSKNDFDYCMREFPPHEDFAWSSGGSSYFGTLELQKAKPTPPWRMYKFEGSYVNRLFNKFEDLITFEKNSDYGLPPHIKLWSPPRQSERYAIGADTSMGESYGDYSYGSVRNINSRELMCSFHGRFRPDELAHVIVSLAKIYNNATVGPECNHIGSGMSCLQFIQRIGYSRIYTWIKRDHVEGPRFSTSAGWWTTARSRPMMLGAYRNLFIDCMNGVIPGDSIFRDISTINEMRTFVPDKNNIPRALNGCYDDRVMGDAITNQICEDLAYRTSGDLIHTYRRHQPEPQKQNQQTQNVDPLQLLKFMGRGGEPGKQRNPRFEMNERGQIICPPEV